MRVGFDAKKAIRNHTGIGNYSRRCIRAVEETGVHVCYFYGRLPVLGELWRNFLQWWSVRRAGVDVYHGLSNELPFGIRWSGAKSVVTIHDLIFLRFPKTYGWFQRRILELKTRYACRVADRIVAVSEMTRQDIIRYYGIDPSRIEVIYQSIDECFLRPLTDEQIEAVRRRYDLPSRYVLCVGTIQMRKNQHTLVRSLPLLPADVHLVLVGKPEPYAQIVQQMADELGVASRVHLLKNVPTTDLPAIYQSATVFVCLSRFEGFGIPLAEALASGTPVIGATGSCLEEAGGPDSIYLAPDDYKGLASVLRQLLDDPQRQELMSSRGRTYVQRFSDRQLGEHLLDLYHRILTTSLS